MLTVKLSTKIVREDQSLESEVISICSENIKIISVNAKLGHWTPETRNNLNQNPEFGLKF